MLNELFLLFIMNTKLLTLVKEFEVKVKLLYKEEEELGDKIVETDLKEFDYDEEYKNEEIHLNEYYITNTVTFRLFINLRKFVVIDMDLSMIHSCYKMFDKCYSLEEVIWRNCKTNYVSTEFMFGECFMLKYVEISGLCSTNAAYMFDAFGSHNINGKSICNDAIFKLEIDFEYCVNMAHMISGACCNMITLDCTKCKPSRYYDGLTPIISCKKIKYEGINNLCTNMKVDMIQYH